jgi:hypothetical protein
VVCADASADSKAVEKLAKTSVTELAKLSDNTMLGFSDDALVISETGNPIDMKSSDGCVSGAVANAFYGCVQASIQHKVGTIAAGGDATLGWFQAPFTVIVTGDDPDGKPSKPDKSAMRMGGIVVGSEIVAAVYVRPISDKDLLKGTGGTPATGSPKLTGDQKLAGSVASWFSTGFAPAAAKKGTLIASGTSAAEFKSGTAAVTLAKSWDKLKLGAISVDAKLLGGGKIGWVTADVTMPRKSGKGAVEMKLVAIVVPDGDSWRWVSLMYQPPFSR